MTCADLDGDGSTDLAIANLDDTFSILLNLGDGSFAPQAQHRLAGSPCSVTHGDFDGDGAQDLALVTVNGGTVSLFSNRGDGTFEPGTTLELEPYLYPRLVQAADVDGDGVLDLLVGGDSLAVFLGRGNGRFEPAVKSLAGYTASAFALAQMDGSGGPDLAMLQGNQVDILLNLGGGSSSNAVRSRSEPSLGR